MSRNIKAMSLLLLISLLLSCMMGCTQPPANEPDTSDDTDNTTALETEAQTEPEPEPEDRPTKTPDKEITPPDLGESGTLGTPILPEEPEIEKPANPTKSLLEKTKEPYNGGNLGCTKLTLLPAYNRGVDFEIQSVQDFDNKRHYLYLPCRADLSSVTFSATHRDGSVSGPYTADFSDETLTDNEHMIGSVSDYAICVMQSDLPTVMLQIDETFGTIADMNADDAHETYTYGTMVATVTDEMAKEMGWQTRYESRDEDAEKNAAMSLRGRGNATWDYPKRPYQLVTENNLNLFGMGSSNKYLLLANYNDAAGMRTQLALEMGHLLGVPYTSDYRQVDVFMNGQYLGMYTIAEKVEAEASRVAIDLEDDILFEIDNYASKEPAFAFQTDRSKAIHKWRGYRVHSPEDESVMERAKAIIAAAEEALYTGDDETVAKYFDLKSFANMYFVQMYSMNADAFNASLYFYYNSEDGKLYACAPWDFDWSFGVSHRSGAYHVDPLQYDVKDAQWIKQLLTHDNFLLTLLEEYYANGGKTVIDAMPSLVNRFAWENRRSALMNESSIPMMYYPSTVKNYDQAIAYVKDICVKRTQFMEERMSALATKYSYVPPSA